VERSVNFCWVSVGGSSEGVEELAELCRQWSAKLHSFAGAGVRESNFCGMQKIAAKRREGYVANSQLRGGSVKSVAYDRMFECGKMDAYLVRATRVQLNLQKSRIANTGHKTPVRSRLARIHPNEAASSSHSYAALGVPGDGQINAAALRFHEPVHEGNIDFFDFTMPKRFAELRVCRVAFCHQNDSRSVFIEAVNNAGAQRVPSVRQGLSSAKKGIDQRSTRVPSSGVNDHS